MDAVLRRGVKAIRLLGKMKSDEFTQERVINDKYLRAFHVGNIG